MSDKITYNKDGTPRKKGSGRKKDSKTLITVPLSELTSQLPATANVVIGRKWAESIGLVVSVIETGAPKLTPQEPVEESGPVVVEPDLTDF